MASEGPPLATLEDLAYCPVCFEFFTNPQSLGCRHVLCMDCVQSLIKDGQIECPECRHISKLQEVKKDFNKQSLVDVYLQHQEQEGSLAAGKQSTSTATTTCKSCDKNNEIQWNCEECNQNMCGACYKVHSSFSITKLHHVNSIQDLAQSVKNELEQTLVLLRQQKQFIQGKLKTESQHMKDLVSLKQGTIGSISRYCEDLKSDIDRHHDELLSEVDLYIGDQLNQSNKRHHTIHNFFKETEKRIMIISDLVGGRDVERVIDSGASINSGAKGAIEEVDHEARSLESPLLPQIDVIEPELWNSNCGTKVFFKSEMKNQLLREKSTRPLSECSTNSSSTNTLSIKEESLHNSPQLSHKSLESSPDRHFSSNKLHDRSVSLRSAPLTCSSQGKQRSVSMSIESRSIASIDSCGGASVGASCDVGEQDTDLRFHDNFLLLKSKQFRFKKDYVKKLDCSPWKLLCVRDEVWVTADDRVRVYNIHTAELQRIIYLLKVKKARAVIEDVKMEKSANLIAACKDGLHCLNFEGNYLFLIKDGKYSDTKFCNRNLYALEYKKKKIVVFDRASAKWTQVQSIGLNYNVGCESDTFCVMNETLYVASDINCCIQIYNKKGDLLSTIGRSGVMKPDELYKPRISQLDHEQNTGLLITDCFNNVVKLYSNKQWHVLSCLGSITKPVDTLIRDQNIWICNSDKQLIKYSLV